MFKKFNLFCLYVLTILVVAFTPSLNGVNADFFANASESCPKDFFNKIINVFNKHSSEPIQDPELRQSVFISGKPLGFVIDGGGVVVVSMGEVKVNGNFVPSPCESAGIKSGDVIFKANNLEVTSGERLIDIVNEAKGMSCELGILREEEEIKINVTPLYDSIALSYRLGIWVRDNSVGVGTVTYVTQDNGFSALGHPVSDVDTGTIMPVGTGKVYKCSIVGVKRGQRGEPGELKGLFLKSSNNVGTIDVNNKNGIRGKFKNSEVADAFKSDALFEVAFEKEVMPGKAQIYTTVDGSSPKYYDIEIIKTNHVNSDGRKCMVIKITDKKLLEVTNGIVQGMSGSPVIQNGRLVGCVTHVFINDPGKGFAEFISI